MCVIGILLALLERDRSGKGQVVEADMVCAIQISGSCDPHSCVFAPTGVRHPLHCELPLAVQPAIRADTLLWSKGGRQRSGRGSAV